VFLSYLYYYRSDSFRLFVSRYRKGLLIGGILALCPFFVLKLGSTPAIYTVGFAIIYVACGAILISVVDREPKESAAVRVMSYFGARSYSIYLWHLPVLDWGVSLGKSVIPGWNWYWYISIIVFGSLLAGAAMAHLVEMPTLKLRERVAAGR
jgi:peptidoglycan/LPS O-acetylase OafA/YrhL